MRVLHHVTLHREAVEHAKPMEGSFLQKPSRERGDCRSGTSLHPRSRNRSVFVQSRGQQRQCRTRTTRVKRVREPGSRESQLCHPRRNAVNPFLVPGSVDTFKKVRQRRIPVCVFPTSPTRTTCYICLSYRHNNSWETTACKYLSYGVSIERFKHEEKCNRSS
jgi:hypothetical protein